MKRKGKNNEPVIRNIHIDDPFWSPRQQLVIDTVIPYQEAILNDQIEEIPDSEKSHAIDNFRIAAGLMQGEFHGMVFQDSDFAKWLEGVANALAVKPDSELEARADAVIDIIAAAQQPDGYLNTYFTIKEPERRFQNLQECHELYCAGHMIEAAVAYYEATGKDKLLNVMIRMADCIAANIGPEEGKLHGVPGHEEIELALLRLYRVTGEERFLRQAEWFINTRGQDPDVFVKEYAKRGWAHWNSDPQFCEYTQVHMPVRMQKKARGHSVRAVYLYTAMADLALETGDQELLEACRTLFRNITQQQMYITGGIGQVAKWEGFSDEYDLPNDTVYAETCASIGLVFMARKLLEHGADGAVADVMERALYNGILSGMQLDGKRFFYVNPLEIIPGISGKLPGYEHVRTRRPQWYACACCPPNVVRLLTSLGRYAWGEAEGVIYSHLFVGGTADLEQATVQVVSEYPWNGKVQYTVRRKIGQSACNAQSEAQYGSADAQSETKYGSVDALSGVMSGSADAQNAPLKIGIHIPSHITDGKVCVGSKVFSIAELQKNGYLYIDCTDEVTEISLKFELPVRMMRADPRVRSCAGKVALMRGPLVYCLEEADNGPDLHEIIVPESTEFHTVTAAAEPLTGMTLLRFDALRETAAGENSLPYSEGNRNMAPEADKPTNPEENWNASLYTEQKPSCTPVTLTAIPYFAWANRTEGAMRVWLRTQ